MDTTPYDELGDDAESAKKDDITDGSRSR